MTSRPRPSRRGHVLPRRRPGGGRFVPWLLLRVAGPSMVPTLRAGDVVLAWRWSRVRRDDVVIGRFLTGPQHLVVKRADHWVAPGWWLRSENPFAGGDSDVHGPADVLAVVRVRWRRGDGFPLRRPGRPPCQTSGQFQA